MVGCSVPGIPATGLGYAELLFIPSVCLLEVWEVGNLQSGRRIAECLLACWDLGSPAQRRFSDGGRVETFAGCAVFVPLRFEDLGWRK